jgi:hypothetical protein
MLRSRRLGRLMNLRRIPLTLGAAVGAAFAAALIGLANAPAARADTEPEPFQDLFGDSGINTWTPSADSLLNSSDPTLAGNWDTSVENFLLNMGNQEDPFSIIAYRLDASAFSHDPAAFGYFLDDGVPLNATGDFALGLDWTLSESGIGATLDPIIFLFLDPFLYGPL